MSLLTIIYWVLLVLAILGLFVPTEGIWVRGHTVVILVLFIIIGIKLLRPQL